MAFTFLSVGLRAGAIVATLLAGAVFPSVPTLAASGHAFQKSETRNSGSGGSAFDADNDRCPGAGRHRGNGGCEDDLNTMSFHQENSRHHPGSRAFGLQFNSGDN